MKEIVILSDHSNERLLEMLKRLFPECELRVLPKKEIGACRPEAAPERESVKI